MRFLKCRVYFLENTVIYFENSHVFRFWRLQWPSGGQLSASYVRHRRRNRSSNSLKLFWLKIKNFLDFTWPATATATAFATAGASPENSVKIFKKFQKKIDCLDLGNLISNGGLQHWHGPTQVQPQQQGLL